MLPDDVSENCLLYLDIKYILKCRLNCSQFNDIFNGETLWRQLFYRDFSNNLQLKDKIPKDYFGYLWIKYITVYNKYMYNYEIYNRSIKDEILDLPIIFFKKFDKEISEDDW